MKPIREYEMKVFERVNPAVRFSVTRYVLAVGIFLAVVAFGLISAGNLGVDLLPSINVPFVVVSTVFTGATPSVVDQQITQVIENVVSTVSGITDIDSTSSIGFSRVVISFDPGTDKNADMNQVAALVGAAVRKLPSGVNPPTVQTFDPNSQPILQFGISGEGSTLAQVGDYVTNTLIPVLERVDGVANIQTDGAPTRQFQVLLNPERLRYYGLNPGQVVTAITNSAVNQPIGTIVTKRNALTFATENVPSSLSQISQVLVDSSRGVTVGLLGTVRDSATAATYARVNSKPVVLVSIQRTTDSNSVAVASNVRKLMTATQLPAGYSITYSNDTTGPIRASVNATYRELLLTGAVVALIVLLFLGRVNTAFSVILAIPIALSAAPVLYQLAGFTFNLVSLLAMIIAIGIVVDDSIVVAENVERYRAIGMGLKESVLKGASEVFSAVVAASLSLLSVLLPVSFIGGFIGRYLQQFSLGLAAAVAFSLLEAVLFLTVRLAYTPQSRELTWPDFFKTVATLGDSVRWGLANWRKAWGIFLAVALAAAALVTRRYLFLPGLVLYPLALGLAFYAVRVLIAFLEAITTTLHAWTEAVLEWVRDKYTASLGSILKYGVLVLAGSAVFLAVSAVLIAPRIPFNFVPQTDSGVLRVFLRLPSGTPTTVINEDAGRIEAYLLQRPEVETVQTVVGGFTNLIVQLGPVGKRPSLFALVPVYRRDMLTLLRDQPSARLGVSAGGGFQGAGSSLDVNVTAADLNTLQSRNAAMVSRIQNNPFVSDVNSSLSDTTLENDFVPDTSMLKGTGISPGTVADSLQTYAAGTQASNVIVGGLSYPIQVQVNPIYLAGGQSLLNMPIYSSTLQTTLQVGQLGSFVLTQAPVSISRHDRLYSGEFTVNSNPNAPTQLSLQNSISEDLAKAGLTGNGVTLSPGGRFSQTALAAQLVSTGSAAFLLALFLAYLVMAAQFNSWRYPVYLLLPVPLAIVGALWLVFLEGGGLDIFGVMGMLMLIGLSAKNAILYLDFVVERIGKMPFAEALKEAARLRFRPIVMTTLTVLVISFPLIFGHGEGAEFGQRLGIVMLGGIVFSAVLTFFVVPAAFYLFERRRVEAREASEARRVAEEAPGAAAAPKGVAR